MVRNEFEICQSRTEDSTAPEPAPGRVASASAATFAVLLVAILVCLLSAGCDAPETPAGEEVHTATPDWGQAQGRWHGHGWMEVPPEKERALTAEQRAEFAKLRSLGYLSGSSPAPVNTGVVIYDGQRTSDGLNFYTSGHLPSAVLMDMAGNRLHEWRMGFADAWAAQPGDDPPGSIKGSGYWRRAHLFENGDVLAIFEGLGLIKVDRHSNLLWARFGGFHHDMDVTDSGLIYVLTRTPRIIPAIHRTLPVLEDFVAVLDGEGNELSRVSVLEALRSSDIPGLLDGLGEHGDILHTNTVEVLDGRLAGRIPAFASGNVLVCIRELSVIAVLDLELEKVVWGMDGSWGKPHQSTVLDNGNLLIFDNRGNAQRSQVIELDPVTFRAAWIYRGETPYDFYSWECGSNQRLENGNTLITESDRGKAFEVTPDGTIIWKYLNPMRAGDDLEFIATIFELVRLPSEFPVDWLGDAGDGRR